MLQGTVARPRTRLWLLAGVAVLSVVSVPLLFGPLLVVGWVLFMGGALLGAITRRGRWFERSVWALQIGGALLVGPAVYAVLALAR